MNKLISKKNAWLLISAGVLVFCLGAAMLRKAMITGDPFHITVIPTFITMLLTAGGIGGLVILLLKRAQRYSSAQLVKRMIPTLLLFYLGATLIANLAIALSTACWFVCIGRPFSEYWLHLRLYELPFAGFGFFFWLLCFTIGFVYVLWHKSVKKEQQLREENLRYKYQNLKAQVNPHFLFNSLNTLSELVYEDAAKADAYIRQLADIYRYILEHEDTNLVPLEQEIDFVKRYVSLQQARNAGKIKLEMDVKEAVGRQVLPVSLQILVENALKHNVLSEEVPLSLSIRYSKDCFVITNNVQKKTPLEDSPQTGLSNLNERLKLITGKELTITQDSTHFCVTLPLV